MSQPADSVTRQIGLVLCLRVTLAPMRVSAQGRMARQNSRRGARLLAGIPDGIAVILGAEGHGYPVRFRQSPDLYYLTACLEEPELILVLNGVTRHAAIFARKRPSSARPSPRQTRGTSRSRSSATDSPSSRWRASSPIHIRLEDTVIVTETGSRSAHDRAARGTSRLGQKSASDTAVSGERSASHANSPR